MRTIRNNLYEIKGRPITNQRRILLDIIRQTEGHLDADEIYRQAKLRDSRISLATVYRNLKLFKEIDIIVESQLGDTHSYYERKDLAEHYHLVCLGCGRVIEFDSPLIARAVNKIKKDNGFKTTSIQLKITGYCKECQSKNE
jgi:Fur family ferric uptake transcriptional regulator